GRDGLGRGRERPGRGGVLERAAQAGGRGADLPGAAAVVAVVELPGRGREGGAELAAQRLDQIAAELDRADEAARGLGRIGADRSEPLIEKGRRALLSLEGVGADAPDDLGRR